MKRHRHNFVVYSRVMSDNTIGSRSILALATVLAILMAGCSSQVGGGNNPIAIAAVGPMTGSAAARGKDLAQAARMAADEANAAGGVNGHRIELAVYDDGDQTAASQPTGRANRGNPRGGRTRPSSQLGRGLRRGGIQATTDSGHHRRSFRSPCNPRQRLVLSPVSVRRRARRFSGRLCALPLGKNLNWLSMAGTADRPASGTPYNSSAFARSDAGLSAAMLEACVRGLRHARRRRS